MTPTLSSTVAHSTYSHKARIRTESKKKTLDPESALTLTMTSNANRLVGARSYDSTYAWVILTTAQRGTDCSPVFLPCDRTEGLKVSHPRSHTHSTRQLPPAQLIHKPSQKPEAEGNTASVFLFTQVQDGGGILTSLSSDGGTPSCRQVTGSS